ncbi:tRNA (adenosine(37)-N6)-dimethylallyltransferase MiaA [Pedobacter duraquae]|uniref:tRNA dimethylallyltransferase n=1 Tax=Pedobacter duraquae TaxID=425511 RepID=A0A4R6IJ25_9SPHI|nr:tRNA (adenosine(37)-N6)-dimethylallyltransferase MiaA [Pedobacter duraquae]TDO22004.1 tRNA dimethylallyltransferase [Pedobacter duraquae]
MPDLATPKTLIVIAGPTAVGKTALGIEVAKHYRTEIISADSRQFFIETEIGTAKPSADELTAVKHHFINSHHIHDFFSTGDFEQAAIKLLEELFTKYDVLVLVGGSGLYINALLNGLDDLPATDLNIRAQLNATFLERGLEPIKEQLSVVDPEYFASVDQQNPQRLVRGLEFYLSTGQKLSAYLHNTKKKRPFNIIRIGLNKDRQELYDQINYRVDLMMDNGLLDEVRSLLPYRSLNALKTVGYSELFDYLDGLISLEDAINSIKQNTRRFAKRQLTWFRKDSEMMWYHPSQISTLIADLDVMLVRPKPEL